MWHNVQSSVWPDGTMASHRHRDIHEASLVMGPLMSLIAGILILIVPRLLNYIVAIYLIIVGLLGLFGSGVFR